MKVKQRVGWLCTNAPCIGLFYAVTLTGERPEEIDRKVEELAACSQARCGNCGAKPPIWRLDRARFQVVIASGLQFDAPTHRLEWEPVT